MPSAKHPTLNVAIPSIVICRRTKKANLESYKRIYATTASKANIMTAIIIGVNNLPSACFAPA